MSKGTFEFFTGYPTDVLAFEAVGEIDAEAYETQLIPAVEAKIAAEGKVKLLYVLGDRFEGFTMGAAWDDTKLGLSHLGDFGALALVTDTDWIRHGMKIFAPLVHAPLRVFHVAELEEAKAWIREIGRPAEDHSHDAAAERKLSTLEDKIPPGA
ncbi:STAS/SEC14 domain-containing protein [Thioclava pacifica]|uniref:STAS/SEC14 domain-containing protein n=1 Tax=Thioclava pacifica DSM 10166 TaxID=1353537 RepID=A0A074J3G9_9RHOB|nr:STAS/SEC14 domain-containing protein [Thioclava pacifica]KEO50480.1 hypothetical protein TP2_14525 [Thioclava pacifica DSM 10166]